MRLEPLSRAGGPHVSVQLLTYAPLIACRSQSKGPCHAKKTTIFGSPNLGARLRGRTATQRSKKGSENVLGRVLGKGFSEGF